MLRFVFAAALLLLPPAGPAHAQEAAADRVTIAYEEPTNPAHRPLAEALRARNALETARQALSPLKLPRALTLRAAGCDGDVNAWFDGDSITICYEYVAWIVEVAGKPGPLGPVPREQALAGPLLEVVLHEAAHAIFDYLEIPILGREEDAADQMAALWILTVTGERAPALVASIAATYLDEAGVKTLRQLERRRLSFSNFARQADVHSLPMQRLYNLLCLALGADPARFGDIARRGTLPADRADGCEDEYRQAARAWTRLIQPHVDREVARRVYGANFGPAPR